MDCIVCDLTLESVEREGITLDQCPAGHGAWLDEGELRQAVERMDLPRSAEEKEAAFAAKLSGAALAGETAGPDDRPCPVCASAMERVVYDETSGVVVDSCMDHGVWVDAGELEKVEAWIEANRDELAPVREHLQQQTARLNAEVDEALAAGEGKGPLSTLFAMVHYARHSRDAA